MKIGIIGPTRIKEFCISINVSEADYYHFLEKVSEHLASTKHELVIVPSLHTAPGTIARIYKDYRGEKVWGIVPHDDEEFGLMDVDETVADENINCGTWRNQPENFCEFADILLVVGLSPGSMIEICYSKWFKHDKVFIFEDFLSNKLHPEVEKDLRVEYINMQTFSEKIT